MSGERVAILIKTYNRPGRLLKAISSIREFCLEPYRLYIADDGEISADVNRLYDELRSEGHYIKIYPERVNVTTARNHLVSMLGPEEFVLRLDDDFNFTPETDLGAMVTVMKNRPEISAMSDLERQLGNGKGVLSGEISSKQGHTFLKDDVLHKMCVSHQCWNYLKVCDVRFAYANFTRNFLLIRRMVFDRVKWRDDIEVHGEHAAFMLDLQAAGWALAFTPDSIHVHNESAAGDQTGYGRIRHATGSRDIYRKLFLRVYGIRTVRSLDAEGAMSMAFFHKIRKRLGLLRASRTPS